jgi:hypothetical protein
MSHMIVLLISHTSHSLTSHMSHSGHTYVSLTSHMSHSGHTYVSLTSHMSHSRHTYALTSPMSHSDLTCVSFMSHSVAAVNFTPPGCGLKTYSNPMGDSTQRVLHVSFMRKYVFDAHMSCETFVRICEICKNRLEFLMNQ